MIQNYNFSQIPDGLSNKLCRAGQLKTFPIGTELVRKGERPEGVWLILEGEVECVSYDINLLRPLVVEIFDQGNMVGWLGLLGDSWIEHLQTRTSIEAFFVCSDVFLDLFQAESSLKDWCKKQTPAIEIIDVMSKLSAPYTRRNSYLSDWHQHHRINRIALEGIDFSFDNLIEIPGGNWYSNDGSLFNLQDKHLLTDKSRLIFLSFLKEEKLTYQNQLSKASLICKINNNNLPKTIVIFGNARGGTTMVAKIVKTLGIDIGLNSEEPFNLEDRHFRYDLYHGDKHDDIVKQIEICAIRNNAYKDEWGWKYPCASLYLKEIVGVLRNPHIICVYRDIFACAMKQFADKLDCKTDNFFAEDLLAKEAQHCLANIDMIKRLDLPTLMCSYEKAILYSEDFIYSISDFLDIEMNPKLMKNCLEAIHPGSYYNYTSIR